MFNVFGEKLKLCSLNPLTGYTRNGYCNLDRYDKGTHIVCAVVTKKFLDFTYENGNDLISRRGEFPGLKPGDKWCLCVLRWIEAYKKGVAPFIDLESTEYEVLKYVPLELLIKYSI
jgi:uncharacterized protein (DUF2237 family)